MRTFHRIELKLSPFGSVDVELRPQRVFVVYELIRSSRWLYLEQLHVFSLKLGNREYINRDAAEPPSLDECIDRFRDTCARVLLQPGEAFTMHVSNGTGHPRTVELALVGDEGP